MWVIESFTGSIPQYYDRNMGPVLFNDYAEVMAKRAVECQPARVLETAAGTGIVTRKLRDLLSAEVNLIATDLNPPMLEFARSKFGLGEKVGFEPADAMALPFADNSFDLVVCQFGVMFYPDKDKAYREVWRVLAPSGRYLFSVWDTHRHNAWAEITHELVTSLFATAPPQFMRVPFFYQFDDIKDSAMAAGFTQLSASVIQQCKTVAEAGNFARGMIYGSPLFDAIKARGVDPEPIVEDLTRRLQSAFGASPIVLSLQAIFFSAAKPARANS